MQLVLAAGGAGMASWGVSSGMFAAEYMGMSTVGLGFSLGSMLGGMLFAPKTPDMQGPRLSDKSVQGSAYGTFIPIVYGRMRIAGNIIWATDLVEVANEEDAGGKGGGGASYTTYTYFANFAVALCEGELDGIRKIWADGHLIYNKSVDNDGYTGDNGTMTFYKGTETQEPDAFIESKEGVGNVPAYRGLAYCVFDNFELTKYGNRIPNLTFEVVRGVEFMPNLTYMNTSIVNQTAFAGPEAVDKDSGRFWYVHSTGTNNFLKSYDFETGTVLYNLTYPVVSSQRFNPSSTSRTNDSIAAYADGKLFIAPFSGNTIFWIADADSGALTTVPVLGGSWMQFIKWDPYYEKMYLHSSNLAPKIVPYDINGLSSFTAASPVKVIVGAPTTAFTSLNFAKIIIGIDPTTQELILDSHVIVSFLGDTSASQVFMSSELWILGDDAPPNATISHNAPVRGVAYDEVRDCILAVEDPVSGTGFTLRKFDHDDFGLNKEITHTRDSNLGSNARIFYHHGIDKYVVAYNVLPTVYALFIDPESLDILYEYVGVTSPAGGQNNYFSVRGLAETNNAWLLGEGQSGNGEYAKVPTQLRITAEDAVLGDIVADIAQKAGLSLSDIDVSEMTEVVTGYAITKQAAARAALEPLMTAYFYDAVES